MEHKLEIIKNETQRIGFDLQAARVGSINELRMLTMRVNQFSDYLWSELNRLELMKNDQQN
ncbi:hypothetical protein MFLO_02553 [Listeria floridensis FSL S10-1187]|uniref:Uncharacterized protein n=1 Tax=Listeria floridensis FSL S10-1187 TaxID=1265817 RepID=A0ABN0RHX9_9LIST|nr:hypothetical protein [Listeria floridensis]EUJ33538.1 hypothetical protein MFLO_02553 [Listeria floridensis FSL S10-1187]